MLKSLAFNRFCPPQKKKETPGLFCPLLYSIVNLEFKWGSPNHLNLQSLHWGSWTQELNGIGPTAASVGGNQEKIQGSAVSPHE